MSWKSNLIILLLHSCFGKIVFDYWTCAMNNVDKIKLRALIVTILFSYFKTIVLISFMLPFYNWNTSKKWISNLSQGWPVSGVVTCHFASGHHVCDPIGVIGDTAAENLGGTSLVAFIKERLRPADDRDTVWVTHHRHGGIGQTFETYKISA